MIIKIFISLFFFFLAICSFILAVFVSRKKPFPDSLRYSYFRAKSHKLEIKGQPNSLPVIAGIMVAIIGIFFLFFAVTTINPISISTPLQELIKVRSFFIYIFPVTLILLMIYMGIKGFYRGVVKKDIYVGGDFPVRFEGKQAFIWGLMFMILSFMGIYLILVVMNSFNI